MSEAKPISLEESWLEVLSDEFNKPYFKALKSFLTEEKSRYAVYPPGSLIFNALNLTPFNKVKVVIIGQDPYHGPGQAHGLCFSVQSGIKQPPSLVNIFKEIRDDLGISMSGNNGNLESWAKQGVLLLNATLTVRARQAGSHQNKGWEQFTDRIIAELANNNEGLVFLLWGRYAQNKAALVSSTKHHILKAAHPSPFSAYNGFMGCKHFSQANTYLMQQGKEPINWQID
jgi:uracil-DNA glycosylase